VVILWVMGCFHCDRCVGYVCHSVQMHGHLVVGGVILYKGMWSFSIRDGVILFAINFFSLGHHGYWRVSILANWCLMFDFPAEIKLSISWI